MGAHLITRAGSGIGATVAGLLAEHGEEPWLLARNEERAEALGTRFLRSRTVVADLAEPSVLVTALEKQGLPDRLDFLRHVAGVLEPGTAAGFDAAAWQEILAVNGVAPGRLTRLVLPALRGARGHVVFLDLGAGPHAPPGLGGDAASKFALKALAESLRAEEYRNGLRVTAVYTRVRSTCRCRSGSTGRWACPTTRTPLSRWVPSSRSGRPAGLSCRGSRRRGSGRPRRPVPLFRRRPGRPSSRAHSRS